MPFKQIKILSNVKWDRGVGRNEVDVSTGEVCRKQQVVLIKRTPFLSSGTRSLNLDGSKDHLPVPEWYRHKHLRVQHYRFE